MTNYKRPRCETEGPEDSLRSSNNYEEVRNLLQTRDSKKSKTARNAAEPLRKPRPRPPMDSREDQQLNRLDQLEYENIVKQLSIVPKVVDDKFLARAKFWDRFYAKNSEDKYPESPYQSLNIHERVILHERRIPRPWFFLGLDELTRQRFPSDWPYFYEDGEGGNDEDSPKQEPRGFPQQHTHATSSEAFEKAKDMAKRNFWALDPAEMETVIKLNEQEIEKTMSKRDENLAIIEDLQAEVFALTEALDGDTVRFGYAKGYPYYEESL